MTNNIFQEMVFKQLKSSNAIDKIDIEKRIISYNKSIKNHRNIAKISGDEELIRAFILKRLVDDLGYKPENIELEKEYDIGRPKVNKPRIDVIVKDKNGNAFLYIELKTPKEFEEKKDETIEKQLFNLASQEKGQGNGVNYLVLYSVEIFGDEIQEKIMVIDYEKYPSFTHWEETRDFTDSLPARYNKAQKEPYVKGGKKDLQTNFDHQILDEKRKSLHNVLWGGGGTDDNDIFSSLVNIILAKIQDESEKRNGEKYDFQTFAFAKNDEKEEFETNDQLFDRINKLYKRALKQRLNIVDENKLNKSFVIDENKFSLAKLKYTVQELEKFSFVDGKNSLTGKDILGDFFEGIIREGFKQTKGQFFTHINVVKFLLWGLQLDRLAIDLVNKEVRLPFMIDPSAGSGTFLIEYMKFITSSVKRRFKDKIDETRDIKDFLSGCFYPENRENRWAEKYIYASEHNFNLGTATKVNMILHGDGSSNIFVKDGLLPFSLYNKTTEPNALNQTNIDNNYKGKASDSENKVRINGQFDCILTNPPFSVDLDKDTKKLITKSFIFGEKKNSENLFIERYYQLLKPNGRLGVVLPESVFDTTENKYIRIFIYKYFKVKAVVSLPQITFEPFTSTKTSLLFAQKKTAQEISEWNKIWDKYVGEWSLLSTRCEKEIEHFMKEKSIDKKWAISKEDEQKRRQNVEKMLVSCIEKKDSKLSLKELVEKYNQELENLCKYDKDLVDNFGFANCWWVFGRVAKELNYKIFMAEVENVGYKRTKRGSKPMPNELYRENENGEILLDDEVLETALDYLRQIKWD